MARARNIKPSFFQNEELGDLDPVARLFFIGLWTIADYRGCVEFRPKRLKVQLLPYDECNTETLANNLERSGFIRFYSVCGQRYLKITNFETWCSAADRTESNCASSAKRRASRRMAFPSWANADRIKEIYTEASRRRRAGENVHVDHVIPLSGKLVSGLHVEANLEIVSARDNLKKSNSFEVA